jgi:hypothetical protein
MPQNVRDHNQLAETIRQAFAAETYPGDSQLVYDNDPGHVECDRVASAFKGKHWSELEVTFLRRHADAIFFFTPESFRFFLPAYLLAVVLSYQDSDIIPNNVVHSLTPLTSGAPNEQAFDARIVGFDAQQRLAIKAFLEYLWSEHMRDFPLRDPQLALEKYWA